MIMQVVLLVLMLVMSVFQTGMILRASWFSRATQNFCIHTRQQLLLEELIAVGIARLSGDHTLVHSVRENKVVEQEISWQQIDARLYRGIMRFSVISTQRFRLEVSLALRDARPLCSQVVELEVDGAGAHMTVLYKGSYQAPSQQL